MSDGEPKKKQAKYMKEEAPQDEAMWNQVSSFEQRDQAINQALFKLSRDVATVQYLTTKTDILRAKVVLVKNDDDEEEERFCYFVTDGSITFRHEGCNRRAPPKFFLCDRSSTGLEGKVLVECSASGSGKTVDLAGSSVSRNAHVAIVVSIDDTDANQMRDKGARNAASVALLKEKIEEVLEATPKFKEILKLAHEDHPLRIVVAIDEASRCPKCVRSIIAEKGAAATAVKKSFECAEKSIEIQFSVGGTGAASGSIGSNTQNFEIVEPSGKKLAHRLCNFFLTDVNIKVPGAKDLQPATYRLIETKLPLVATLMQNGRMASIAANELRILSDEVSDEAKLVDAIVAMYLKSNGMKALLENEKRKRAVAACAFAVHLFQWQASADSSLDEPEGGPRTPRDPEKFQEFISSMKCGVQFKAGVEYCVTRMPDVSAVKTIVSRFGLLEPGADTAWLVPGEPANNLFVMKDAQQLVALVMLGMSAKNFLEPTPYGFEMLSTHVAKCAIAAALMMKMPPSPPQGAAEAKDIYRPTLQQVLIKIGCYPDELATSDNVIKQWNSLSEYHLVEHFGGASDTNAMKIGLELVCDGDGNDMLQICKIAFDSLKKMTLERDVEQRRTLKSTEKRVVSALPAAFLNYGASPLFDGSVTFFCKKASEDNIFKFTLMNQAKDYHNGTRLCIKKLNDHAVRCGDVSLDGVFGKERLLCVAGSADVVYAKKKCSQKRAFIPYASNGCKILAGLLETLQDQRNVRTRVARLATFCNEAGEEVEV